ncbi:minor capsid protein [Oceanobacillus sp. E9]|nr:minor capsid protein [Oceanobacillus sp. E9]
MIDVKVDFDKNKVNKKLDNALGFGQFVLDNQVLKDSNYYIPMRSKNTRDSGITHSKIGNGEIRWVTPYVREIYFNSNYNFSKDINPNARGLWFEAAKAEKIKQWLDEAQKAARSKY